MMVIFVGNWTVTATVLILQSVVNVTSTMVTVMRDSFLIIVVLIVGLRLHFVNLGIRIVFS
jgi:hypothetical protein